MFTRPDTIGLVEQENIVIAGSFDLAKDKHFGGCSTSPAALAECLEFRPLGGFR